MDATDRAILDVLRADARVSVRELAAQVGVSRASAYSRLKRLQDTGVIRGFTVDIDPAALGLGLPAYVHVRIKQNSWKTFRQRAWAAGRANPETRSCSA